MKRSRPIDLLTADELAGLYKGTSSPTSVRNSALIAVLAEAGLRVQEALDLRVCDVRFPYLVVQCGKGGKRRTVAVSESGEKRIQRWLDKRRKLGIADAVPMFCTMRKTHSKPLTRSLVRRMLLVRGQRAGIGKRLHPHGLRHLHAFRLAQKGVPIHHVQQQLGHSNLQVTTLYIAHLCPTDVLASVRAAL